jgi:hypothetical protein
MMTNVIEIEAPLVVEPPKKKKSHRKLLIGLGIALLVLIILGAVLYLVIGRPALSVYESYKDIKETIELVKSDFERKDLTKLDSYVDSINSELDLIAIEVDKFQFLKELSATKGYYDNLEVVRELADQTQVIVEKTLPELKVILGSMGYMIEESDVAIEGDNEEKVQAVIKELPRLVELYDSIEADILDLIEIFNRLDVGYIPDFILGDTMSKITDPKALT